MSKSQTQQSVQNQNTKKKSDEPKSECMQMLVQKAISLFPQLEKKNLDFMNNLPTDVKDINHVIEKLILKLPSPTTTFAREGALQQMRNIADEQEKRIQKNMCRISAKDSIQQEIENMNPEGTFNNPKKSVNTPQPITQAQTQNQNAVIGGSLAKQQLQTNKNSKMNNEKPAQKVSSAKEEIENQNLIVEEIHLRDITQTNMPSEPGFSMEFPQNLNHIPTSSFSMNNNNGANNNNSTNNNNSLGNNEFGFEFMQLEKFDHKTTTNFNYTNYFDDELNFNRSLKQDQYQPDLADQFFGNPHDFNNNDNFF